MTKRKQTFYELVLSTPVSNQSSSQFRPYLRVEPPTLLIPPFGSVEFKVDLVLAAEQTFLATLLCHASVAGIAVYEIPLTATPKAVNIVLDDTSALNFGMQPLGESESLFRKFRNNGKKDISWVIAHRNSSLQVIPNKGTLKAGAEVRVEFIFSPLDESVQTDPVYFEPDCSTPVRISFLGGGGFSKISLLRCIYCEESDVISDACLFRNHLPRYATDKRFDFGSCMINRTTESGLPITNEGNATLHLTTFDLDESPVYKRGASWPVSR